jgi:hypothetical protein
MKYRFVIVLLILQSCATYYHSNITFNQEFERGDIDKALATLKQHASEAKGHREFLYDANIGLVLSMKGQYEESNGFFENAFLFGEDYRTNYLYEVASYLTNPMITPYRGEDHEHLMLLYYKALNYLKLNNTDEALVECRRLNIRLQQLSDRYSTDTRYRHDAFINTMMGIMYDADNDYNNAFIAYKNAYEIYQNDFHKLFDMQTPPQLKEDLLRTAFLAGLTDELDEFKVEFNRPDYQYIRPDGGELIFFWHNGLCPIKAEWGVNFVVSRYGDMLSFSNTQLGFNFNFNIAAYGESERNALGSLSVFRVAFPKYIERPVYFDQATIDVNNTTIPLQLAEDVNKIAFKCLQERMGHEFSKALIRVALKTATEAALKKDDQLLGSVVGLINAGTERADTRNWQTLPHSIYYCRVPLPEGQSTIKLTLINPHGESAVHSFSYNLKKGQTIFTTFSSLDSSFPNYN